MCLTGGDRTTEKCDGSRNRKRRKHEHALDAEPFQHFHGRRFVEHGETTITTTPTGFVGGGTTTLVDNGRTVVFRATDILANDTGDRIRARTVFVLDLSRGMVRADKGELTCLGARPPCRSAPLPRSVEGTLRL